MKFGKKSLECSPGGGGTFAIALRMAFLESRPQASETMRVGELFFHGHILFLSEAGEAVIEAVENPALEFHFNVMPIQAEDRIEQFIFDWTSRQSVNEAITGSQEPLRVEAPPPDQ